MQEINSLGVPCFSGSCPEIYSEKAFQTEHIGPDVPLVNAAKMGPKSLAFLVHPTLTSDDIALTCSTIDRVMLDATSD
jgi:dTDP-4-amino-4,6-dideoxygalactose transaminase